MLTHTRIHRIQVSKCKEANTFICPSDTPPHYTTPPRQKQKKISQVQFIDTLLTSPSPLKKITKSKYLDIYTSYKRPSIQIFS